MYCPHCGKQVGDEDEFCEHCGVLLDDTVAALRGAGLEVVEVDAPALRRCPREAAAAGPGIVGLG